MKVWIFSFPGANPIVQGGGLGIFKFFTVQLFKGGGLVRCVRMVWRVVWRMVMTIAFIIFGRMKVWKRAAHTLHMQSLLICLTNSHIATSSSNGSLFMGWTELDVSSSKPVTCPSKAVIQLGLPSLLSWSACDQTFSSDLLLTHPYVIRPSAQTLLITSSLLRLSAQTLLTSSAVINIWAQTLLNPITSDHHSSPGLSSERVTDRAIGVHLSTETGHRDSYSHRQTQRWRQLFLLLFKYTLAFAYISTFHYTIIYTHILSIYITL